MLELNATASLSMSAVLRTLHKERRQDRISHLRSINHDAEFVALVHAALGSPPLLANLRCGEWYAPPSLSSGHCYFKSTDGHVGCWDFSLSRLNLQAALVGAAAPRTESNQRSNVDSTSCSNAAVMVVDSTRSGKRFPDALSKTVPIWCCVINRALAQERREAASNSGGDSSGDSGSWDTALHLPPWVPPSEAAQIEERLDGWVATLRRPALASVLRRLVDALHMPLRPNWLCPPAASAGGGGGIGAASGGAAATGGAASSAATYAAEATRVREKAAARGAPFVWVHCVCASEACTPEQARERASYTYIQGAGDDDENWARGLTAELWWKWREEIIRVAARDPEGAEEMIVDRLAAHRQAPQPTTAGTVGGAASDAAAAAADVADLTLGEVVVVATTPPPCALWDSGLLLGSRLSAAVPAVWKHADAVLDVGGSWSIESRGEAADAASPPHRGCGCHGGCGCRHERTLD